jgi:hypothetical protein
MRRSAVVQVTVAWVSGWPANAPYRSQMGASSAYASSFAKHPSVDVDELVAFRPGESDLASRASPSAPAARDMERNRAWPRCARDARRSLRTPRPRCGTALGAPLRQPFGPVAHDGPLSAERIDPRTAGVRRGPSNPGAPLMHPLADPEGFLLWPGPPLKRLVCRDVLRMGDPGLEPGTSSLSEKRSNRLS